MYLTIKNWNIVDKQKYIDDFSKLPDWTFVIKKEKLIRTTPQNAYYWSLIDIVSKETGIDKEEIHDKMRMKFLYMPPKTDKQLPYCKSTTKLTTGEFTEYIENLRNFFAELLWLQLPDAKHYDDFISEY